MKATLADEPFSDDDWLFELKLDGYRVEAVVDRGRVQLWTRNKQDGARYFPDLAAAKPTWISAETAIVDGEVVALNEAGEPDFSRLQDRAGMGRFGASGSGLRPDKPRDPAARTAPITYFVFDLLYLDGRSLVDVPLEHRKRLLKTVLREHSVVRYGAHIEADGEAFYRLASQRRIEGIMAKERHSRYEPGRRSKAWLKLKIRREQELVVGGYEEGKGSHRDLGSLIVGVYDGDDLRFAGHVGSGIAAKTRRELVERLDALRIDDPPFVDAPRIRGAHWVKPEVVIRAEFAEWTTDHLLRQAAFKGFDIEKDPKKVVREDAVSSTAAARTAERAAKAPRGTATKAPATKQAAVRAAATKAPATKASGRATSSTSATTAAVAGPTTTRPAAPTIEPAPRSRATAKRPTKPAGPPQAATDEELAALEAAPSKKTAVPWSVGGHDIPLTNLDKVLFPDVGFTKRDLIRYYVTIAPVLLPYLRGRALNLWRWPDGITGPHFWQKEIPGYAPEWMARWAYPDAGSTEAHTYIVADRVATLAWIANHAAIDLHPWTSTVRAYRRPTYALIDIDPGEKTTWDEVLSFARLYRAAMDHLGVVGFPKMTGKRGIQVWVPVKPIYSYRQTSAWVEDLSRAIGALMPESVSWEWEKAARKGRARLDYTQNAVNKTLVAPYAVRPAAGAPVSAPITWDELDDPDLRPNRWNIRTVLDRVRDHGDLFAGVLATTQELPPVS
jgi:bifunctional non-homologous end joining protein LigD